MRAKIEEYIKKGVKISTTEEFDLLMPNPIQEEGINGDMNSEHMSQVDHDETCAIMCDAETNYEEVEDAVVLAAVVLDAVVQDAVDAVVQDAVVQDAVVLDVVVLEEEDEDDEDDEDEDMDGEEKEANAVDGYCHPSCTNIMTTDDSTCGRKGERSHGKFCRTCKTEITKSHIQKAGSVHYCRLINKDNTEGVCKHVECGKCQIEKEQGRPRRNRATKVVEA